MLTAEVRKDDAADQEQHDDWTLDGESQQRVHDELVAFLIALLATVGVQASREAVELAAAGNDYGGGGLTRSEVEAIGARVAQAQRPYLSNFEQDYRARIAAAVREAYPSEEAFLEAVRTGILEAAGDRAVLYARATGQQAWFYALAGSSMRAGIGGGVWVRSFGSDSCRECLSLHGTWMTWREFLARWQHTICNGRCNCGIVPSNGDIDMSQVDDLGPPADSEDGTPEPESLGGGR